MTLSQFFRHATGPHRRFLLLGTLAPTAIALVVCLLMPREYLSQTSVLPANSRFSDRARFTAQEITELYSAFGSGDDLDRLYATARAHPVMMKMVDSFGLVAHYRLQKRRAQAREAALREFRENCGIFKTEFGEMHVKVWDRDSVLAARIANAMVAETEKVHQDLYRNYFATALQKMETAYADIVARGDTAAGPDPVEAGKPVTSGSLSFYRRSITDYRMALLSPPPALMVLEKAIPSVKPDRPKVLLILAATFLVSLTTTLAALFLFPPPGKKS